MTDSVRNEQVQTFSAPASQWWQAIAFFLLMSLLGLQFIPALILILIYLLWRWRNNRYACLIELMFFFGGYAFTVADSLPFKPTDLALALGIVGIVIYRKNTLVMKITLAMICYFASLILIATTSLESLSVQFLMMRNYFSIVSFFIPLLMFANTEFEWDKFIRQMTLHVLVICGFYVVDTFLFSSYVLMPGTSIWLEPMTFTNISIKPFSFIFPRHYPPGLYWFFVIIVALNYKQIRFSKKQWFLIALTLYACRTSSYLFALIACFALFRSKVKQILNWSIIGLLLLTATFFIDKATGGHMRLSSTVEQFTELTTAHDIEDLAEFGSGRMAQIIPKWELLSSMNRRWLGFGFLHNEKTTNPVFQIDNEFYSDTSKSEEVATAVEVTQVQTILDCGFLGLIIQTLFYLSLYFILKPTGHSREYLCVITGMSICGIAGFGGLIMPHSLLIIGTVIGAALLAYRSNPQNGLISNPKPAKL